MRLFVFRVAVSQERTSGGGRKVLRPAAQETQQLVVQIRTGGWIEFRSKDAGCTDHPVHRLERLLGPTDGALIEELGGAHGAG